MAEFCSTLTVNSLFWIMSLEPTQQGVTRRIQEDLIPYLDQNDLYHYTFEPRTAGELLEQLDHISQMAHSGLRPIVHLDTHGNAESGIKIIASGEYVLWPDLVDRFRKINIATGNNLCVVSGACYSMNAVWQIKLSEPCPFFMLIAPENEVSSGFLEEKMFRFYSSAFDSLEIFAAYTENLAPTLSLHHSERMLAHSLKKYIKDYCIGKRGAARREELLTKVIAAGKAANRHEVRKRRSEIKNFTRPSQEMIVRFAKGQASTYLMGKPFNLDISVLMDLVKSDTEEMSTRLACDLRLRKQLKGNL